MAFAGALSQRQTTPDKCPDFSDPITENVVYPVFDKDGILSSTIEIDVDIEEKNLQQEEQKKYIEHLEKKVSKISQEKRASEISVLVAPSAISRSTSISRSVRSV